jgi:hypothetical protein
LGSLPDDVTIDAPALSVSLNTLELDESGANVIVTYTVDQDVDASLSVTGIEDTTATLYKSNNTIVVTAGATEFANGQINLVVSNGRSTDTEVINVSASYGWTVDLSNVSYDFPSFSVQSENDISSGLELNNDGTKMYIMGLSPTSVYQYTLSTAFEISTSSYNGVNFDVGSQEGSPRGPSFNNDGTKMYIVGRISDTVHQYSLSSSFDISTASYDNISFYVGSEDGRPYDLTFNSDGTKMYISGYDNGTIYQYTLSSSFDVSTASYDGVNFSVGSQDGDPVGLRFNSDGTKMYVIGSNTQTIYQYTLSSSFDVSTASYDNISFYIGSREGSPTGLTFSYDGTKMYIVGFGNDSVHQYSTGL